MSAAISIDSFRDLFVTDNEFAVIDPRCAADFTAGHLLAATNLPLQQLDNLVRQVIPLNATLCILCDADTGEARDCSFPCRARTRCPFPTTAPRRCGG